MGGSSGAMILVLGGGAVCCVLLCCILPIALYFISDDFKAFVQKLWKKEEPEVKPRVKIGTNAEGKVTFACLVPNSAIEAGLEGQRGGITWEGQKNCLVGWAGGMKEVAVFDHIRIPPKHKVVWKRTLGTTEEPIRAGIDMVNKTKEKLYLCRAKHTDNIWYGGLTTKTANTCWAPVYDKELPLTINVEKPLAVKDDS